MRAKTVGGMYPGQHAAGSTKAGRAVVPAVALLLSIVAAGPAPASEVVLTLARGAEGEETLELTMADLEALPQRVVRTETEFTDGEVAYSGPLAKDVIELHGLETAELLRFTAANDYYVEIPAEDFDRYGAILALEADGQRLSRREKGPLWLIYPISDHPELLDPVYTSRLIWQVVRIEEP